MKNKLYVKIGIGLAVLTLAYFIVKKLRTQKNFPWMKTWSDKKTEVYKDWFINQYSIHTWLKEKPANERTEKATLMFFDGEANVIQIDAYWRGKWEDWWLKVQEAQKLNKDGFKI